MEETDGVERKEIVEDVKEEVVGEGSERGTSYRVGEDEWSWSWGEWRWRRCLKGRMFGGNRVGTLQSPDRDGGETPAAYDRFGNRGGVIKV